MKSLLLILLMSLGLHANADSAKCAATVGKMNQLKDDAMKLNLKNDEEAGKAVSDSAVFMIDDFDKLKRNDPCRAQVWKAFVVLAQAQAPFDNESQAASIIDKRISEDSSLRGPFSEVFQNFPDRCRSELLTSYITLAQCIRINGGDAVSTPAYEKCNMQMRFDYSKCVESKK